MNARASRGPYRRGTRGKRGFRGSGGGGRKSPLSCPYTAALILAAIIWAGIGLGELIYLVAS